MRCPIVDTLVKLWRKSGTETWVLIHLELQHIDEADFAERIFIYNYRLRDRDNLPVASLAILGDENPNWRPRIFNSELWGCRHEFQFPNVKLLGYGQHWAALESSSNPFAIVVMAHLKAKETRRDLGDRQQWKLILAKRLYEQGFERTGVINLLRFIDWVIQLPQDLEKSFWQEIYRYQEETNMPYITSLERIAKEEGLQQGLRDGLLSGIAVALKLRFGETGLQLLLEIRTIAQVETLQAIQDALLTVNTLDDIRGSCIPIESGV
ncbi:hypothetical protein OOK60_12045 [Trichothermofontia sichuanensis B231]|uniref:hypothetical protein n=1 Tax=Trichothermofontia sichuanensis TaxID=3045816 RepID=UPI002246E861|nr:hypothetical protein [Trichothermofontia sichuanensis]UZQ53236.1 hypothetical protein OOK60_12045 [Trichothermofontia sichuanensis B231]